MFGEALAFLRRHPVSCVLGVMTILMIGNMVGGLSRRDDFKPAAQLAAERDLVMTLKYTGGVIKELRGELAKRDRDTNHVSTGLHSAFDAEVGSLAKDQDVRTWLSDADRTVIFVFRNERGDRCSARTKAIKLPGWQISARSDMALNVTLDPKQACAPLISKPTRVSHMIRTSNASSPRGSNGEAVFRYSMRVIFLG